MYERLFVDKPTRTFADELVSFGLMGLVDGVYRGLGIYSYSIHLENCGSYDEITLKPAISLDSLAEIEPFALIPFIKTVKNADKLPSNAGAVDYEEQKSIREIYFKAENRDALTQPHPQWDIFRAINPAALPGYTTLLENWWHIQELFPDMLNLLFTLFSRSPNDFDQAQETWKALDKAQGGGIAPETTSLQLYNPDQGKGQNKTRADGISIGNLKSFWLLEYLKAVGFYEVAITRTVKGGKDRKTFVLVPRKLDYDQHNRLMKKFREAMQTAETSIRFDILASLRYARTLVQYHLEAEDPADDEPWLVELYQPSDEVIGFRTAFYKDLGNAVATMNLSFMALPPWIKIASHVEAETYVRLLDEFILFVRQFNESNSDAFRLLQNLRDFVSAEDLKAFFRFTGAFAGYYMGMRERNKYVKALTPDFIDRILLAMSTENMNLKSIIENEGFQNMAYAIRQSTVVAQFRKGQGSRKYDVRYGLGQDLLRKARYEDDFMVALSDFIAKYNAENAQVMETRPKPYRRSLKTTDFEAIASLIDEYGSELIGNMLVAYGYARSPRPDEDPIVNEIEATEEMNDD